MTFNCDWEPLEHLEVTSASFGLTGTIHGDENVIATRLICCLAAIK